MEWVGISGVRECKLENMIDPRIGYFSPSIKVSEKTEEMGQRSLAFLITAELLFILLWNLTHQPCRLHYHPYSPQSGGEGADVLQPKNG